MKDPISDKNVILIIAATIMMVFVIVFLVTSQNGVYDQQIEWKGPIT